MFNAGNSAVRQARVEDIPANYRYSAWFRRFSTWAIVGLANGQIGGSGYGGDVQRVTSSNRPPGFPAAYGEYLICHLRRNG